MDELCKTVVRTSDGQPAVIYPGGVLEIIDYSRRRINADWRSSQLNTQLMQ